MNSRFAKFLIVTRGLGIWRVEPVTCWSMLDKQTEKFEFNHIENGHVAEWKPVATGSIQQKAWHNQAWHRRYAYLIDGVCHYV